MSPKNTSAKFASNFRIFLANNGNAEMPAAFIALCAFAFVGSVAATVYFCRTMGGGMHMPGGWTMSMMWMRMDGQTWFASAAMFLLMWLAMMVAMMLPSALPTFLRTHRRWNSLCGMASGYFAVWLAAGVVIYAPGVVLATLEMQSDLLSRAVPWLVGASLIAAGGVQFTRWKIIYLSRCRSPFGCAASCPQNQTGFQLGCRQGITCCLCCASPMLILVMLGMMNPFVILGVAIVIAAEKIFPRPEMVARLVGILAIFAGLAALGTASWAGNG